MRTRGKRKEEEEGMLLFTLNGSVDVFEFVGFELLLLLSSFLLGHLCWKKDQ